MLKVKDVELIHAKVFSDDKGELLPFEFDACFKRNIKRNFIVYGGKDKYRGNHAHIKCIQFLTCLSGSCLIKCDDGENTKEIILDKPQKILIIPNEIWASQFYILENTILSVFCTEKYDEKDYIRDYDEFLKFRSS